MRQAPTTRSQPQLTSIFDPNQKLEQSVPPTHQHHLELGYSIPPAIKVEILCQVLIASKSLRE